jgi:hypothetical protein
MVQVSFDFLWFPSVSFGSPGFFSFGAGWILWFSFGFLCFCFFSCGFPWFPLKSKKQISQGKWRLEKAAPDGNASIMTVTLW